MIEKSIVAYLPEPSHGFAPTVRLAKIVNAILFTYKFGVHWRLLPVKALFSDKLLRWQSVYYHYHKWCLSQIWKNCWIILLDDYKKDRDLSSVDFDSCHAPAKRGGETDEYQGRKKAKTTNSLYLTDRQGLSLAMSETISGNHNKLYSIMVKFEVVTAMLEQANVGVSILFLSSGFGFDYKDFRSSCNEKQINANINFNKRRGNSDRDKYFDKKLYDERYAMERTNSWMDSYRYLLNKFDTTIESCKGFNYLSFIVTLVKKINKKKIRKV